MVDYPNVVPQPGGPPLAQPVATTLWLNLLFLLHRVLWHRPGFTPVLWLGWVLQALSQALALCGLFPALQPTVLPHAFPEAAYGFGEPYPPCPPFGEQSSKVRL
eukprot:RCo030720